MKTKIQKWGDSVAIPLPKPFAAEAGLDQSTEVDVSMAEGSVVVRPCSEPTWTLEELLAQVTDDNIHEEVDTGSPVGREIW